MLSIRTDLSSLIVQNSMGSATNKLNQAIERMTTGAKLNHAKDNAANYSIATDMLTKIRAYDVAADNTAMGMDLVTTANDIISQMQDHATRLRSLATQARNGTYGAQSLNAINLEAGARIAEIMRLYNTSEYNGIDLFNNKAYEIADHLKTAGTTGGEPITAKYNGFIEEVTYDKAHVDSLTQVSEETSGFTKTEYKISEVKDLVKLAELTNAGQDTSGITFYLAEDLDLKEYCEDNIDTGGWTPIGTIDDAFKGTFDGCGHKISNVIIDRNEYCQGVFGYAEDGEIKNVGVENVNINCEGETDIGGLIGYSYSSITNCYVIGGNIIASVLPNGGLIGGLIGEACGNITSCYSQCNINAEFAIDIGGLAGYAAELITNCYATGNVSGDNHIGGLVGYTQSRIENCYATGNVSGRTNVGGLVGNSLEDISYSYATGNVSGYSDVGGLAGYTEGYPLSYCYATGSVSGDRYVGGLVGWGQSAINNSYATGNVKGNAFIGGLIGYAYTIYDTVVIEKNASYGKVSGDDKTSTGALIGGVIYLDGQDGIFEVTDNETRLEDLTRIGGAFDDANNLIPDYDLSAFEAEISAVELFNVATNLQVGISSDSASRISFDTNFDFNLSALESDIASDSALASLDEFINLLSEKSTMLGSVSNRLESVLDEILIQHDNLVSSRSTIRDADIAEVSSQYIQQQILQQASATLLSTSKNIQYQNVLGLLQSLR